MTDCRRDSGGDEKPAWWSRNEQLREELDLPPYEPSRLADGAYTHETFSRLEAAYDCSIRLRVKNPQHSSTWSVVVDGEPLVELERRRTKRGNTIFQLTSTELEAAVRTSTRPPSDVGSTAEEGSN